MSTTTAPPTSSAAERKDALVGRLFQAAGGVFETFTVYLGDRLGYYEILAAEGPLTARQLAARTGTNPRYAREWLEQQAVAGIVHVVNPDARADERGFYLPEGHDEVLANPESLDYMAPLAQILAGAVRPLPQLADAFRAGDGIPYEDFGRDLYEGQARLNRAPFLQLLGQEWLPTIPGLRDRLESDPPARIADFGCGAGWSAIGVANTYPKVLIDGFDLDAPSIEMARANAVQAGRGRPRPVRRARRGRQRVGGIIRPRDGTRMHPRYVEPSGSSSHDAPAGSRRRGCLRSRRESGRLLLPHSVFDGVVHVWVERSALSTGGHGRQAVGVHRHRDASGYLPRLRDRGRLPRCRSVADRAPAFPLLLA
jgi:SAM-dependent methyltransferase